MAEHELKTDPEVFQALAEGAKTYEIRRDDRGFGVGDTLILRETASTGAEMAGGAPLEYTGRTSTRMVTHVLRGPQYGLADGWAILSVNDPGKDALAAHVEQLTQAAQGIQSMMDAVFPKVNWGASFIGAVEAAAMNEAPIALAQALTSTPTTSLARRDAEKQAEALDDAAEGFEIVGKRTHADAAQALRLSATELRRQSERGD